MVVVGLGYDFLFKSLLAHCGGRNLTLLFEIGLTGLSKSGRGACAPHNKLRGFYLSSQIVKNFSTQTDCSGGLVLIILRSDAN